MQEVAAKQQYNAEYAFLRAGEGAAYFSWALYCQLNPTAASKPMHAAATPAAAPPPVQPQDGAAAAASLPEDVSSGWAQVLSLLTGSRESIGQSQAWFMACAPYAAGMAELMAQHVETASDPQQQLHTLYLANDILFKAQSKRAPGTPPSADPIAAAFVPRLARMLRRSYQAAGAPPEQQAALLKVVNLWSERGVYEPTTVETLVMGMMGIPTAPQPQSQQPQQPLQQPQSQSQQPPQQQPHVAQAAPVPWAAGTQAPPHQHPPLSSYQPPAAMQSHLQQPPQQLLYMPMQQPQPYQQPQQPSPYQQQQQQHAFLGPQHPAFHMPLQMHPGMPSHVQQPLYMPHPSQPLQQHFPQHGMYPGGAVQPGMQHGYGMPPPKQVAPPVALPPQEPPAPPEPPFDAFSFPPGEACM